jgi:hypothetical protein
MLYFIRLAEGLVFEKEDLSMFLLLALWLEVAVASNSRACGPSHSGMDCAFEQEPIGSALLQKKFTQRNAGTGIEDSMDHSFVVNPTEEVSLVLPSQKSFEQGEEPLDMPRAESQALNHSLQAVANNLAPGPTRDFLRMLNLCAPCQHYERFGEANDGGYVMCTDGLESVLGAFSYGISGYDGWGMGVASKYRLRLDEYDCTNLAEPSRCQGCDVHFHPECILNVYGSPKLNYKTLAQQLQESGNGNAADRSLLLKIDIEAAEWDVLADETVENLKKFREVVVEYHGIEQTDKHDLYHKAVQKLEQAGFSVTHLHGNNCCGTTFFGQYSIPNVIEVTYIPTPPQGCATNIPYRLPQDSPNLGGADLPDAVLPKSL